MSCLAPCRTWPEDGRFHQISEVNHERKHQNQDEGEGKGKEEGR
jgi:hypothetical protein